MSVIITKKDVIWSYIGNFFGIASGMITLPVILHMLSAQEIGMNYIMLSVGALVQLCDCGFVTQFGRNITYVLSGSQSLQRDGVLTTCNNSVDYHLLAVLIKTAQFVYKRLSLLVLFFLLTFGTLYMYHVTSAFTTVDSSLQIWLLYAVSMYFNLYFLYYNALLTGAGMIVESKKAMIFAKIMQIFITFLLLYLNFGLLSVVLANLISPFLSRWYSYRVFFTDKIKETFSESVVTKEEIKELFKTIWFSTKKLGLNSIGGYISAQSGIFLSGVYLSLQDVASYGLMQQIFTILGGVATTLVATYQPQFCKYRVKGDISSLSKEFSLSMMVCYLIIIVGGVSVLLLGPSLLVFIKSQSSLPASYVIGIFLIQTLLHNNHAQFAQLIVTGNKIPFVKASLISGAFMIILNFVFLRYTSMGILGLVLSPFIVESAYNHWRWCLWIFKELKISFLDFLRIGFNECVSRFKLIINN